MSDLFVVVGLALVVSFLHRHHSELIAHENYYTGTETHTSPPAGGVKFGITTTQDDTNLPKTPFRVLTNGVRRPGFDDYVRPVRDGKSLLLDAADDDEELRKALSTTQFESVIDKENEDDVVSLLLDAGSLSRQEERWLQRKNEMTDKANALRSEANLIFDGIMEQQAAEDKGGIPGSLVSEKRELIARSKQELEKLHEQWHELMPTVRTVASEYHRANIDLAMAQLQKKDTSELKEKVNTAKKAKEDTSRRQQALQADINRLEHTENKARLELNKLEKKAQSASPQLQQRIYKLQSEADQLDAYVASNMAVKWDMIKIRSGNAARELKEVAGFDFDRVRRGTEDTPNLFQRVAKFVDKLRSLVYEERQRYGDKYEPIEGEYDKFAKNNADLIKEAKDARRLFENQRQANVNQYTRSLGVRRRRG